MKKVVYISAKHNDEFHFISCDNNGELISRNPNNFFSLESLSNVDIKYPLKRDQILVYKNRKWTNCEYTNTTKAAGNHNEIQLNSKGVFAANASLTFNPEHNTLTVPAITDNHLLIDKDGIHNVQGIIYNKRKLQFDNLYIAPDKYYSFSFPFMSDPCGDFIKFEINDVAPNGGIPHLVRTKDKVMIYNIHKSKPIRGTIIIAYE